MHTKQRNRLLHVARRLKVRASCENNGKMQIDCDNRATLNAYGKDAAKLAKAKACCKDGDKEEDIKAQAAAAAEEVETIDLSNVLKGPKLEMLAKLHGSWSDVYVNEAASITRASNRDKYEGKDGIKHTSKALRGPSAAPLLHVKRDRWCKGQVEGSITTSPMEIDSIVRRAWTHIYAGNSSDRKHTVSMFMNKYEKIFLKMSKQKLNQ